MAPPDQAAPQEPSMEEILASIRKIITSDEAKPAEEAAPAPAGDQADDVLELTDMVEEAPSVQEPVAPEPEPVQAAPEPVKEPDPLPEITLDAPVASAAPPEDLVSIQTSVIASSAFSSLTDTLRQSAPLEGNIPVGDGNRTLEGMVLSLLRPMLKEWLDSNLPPLVEKLVQREIQRIARRNSD